MFLNYSEPIFYKKKIPICVSLTWKKSIFSSEQFYQLLTILYCKNIGILLWLIMYTADTIHMAMLREQILVHAHAILSRPQYVKSGISNCCSWVATLFISQIQYEASNNVP